MLTRNVNIVSLTIKVCEFGGKYISRCLDPHHVLNDLQSEGVRAAEEVGQEAGRGWGCVVGNDS